MEQLTRKQFLTKMALLGLMSIGLPELLRSKQKGEDVSAMNTNLPKNQSKDISDYGIIDLHCHPSLKMFLLNKQMWKRQHPKPGPNILHMQENMHELGAGFVKGLLVAHHLPEGVVRDWTLARFLPIIKLFYPNIQKRIEYENAENYTQINQMIDLLEEQICVVNQQQSNVQFKIAHNFCEYTAAINQGFIPIAHAIEGAHALGRNKPIPHGKSNNCSKEENEDISAGAMIDASAITLEQKAKHYLDNLEALKKRGVCLIT